MGSIWHIGIAVPDLEKGRLYEVECHIGYWVDDLAAEAKRLDALGYPGSALYTGAGKHRPSSSVRRTACVSESSAPGTWAPR